MQVDQAQIDRLLSKLDGIGNRVPPNLPPAPKSANGGGMEPRVAILETHVEHIRKDLEKLSSVPVDMTKLTARVDELPTKSWLEVRLLGMLGLIAAIIMFSDKIRAFVS